MYLQELEMAHDLSSEIIFEISNIYSFPEYLITGYIDELEEFHFSNDLQISRCRSNYREILISFGNLAPFLGVLEFLNNFEDKTELLMVNKNFYKQMKGRVYKEVLGIESLPDNKRLDIWGGCLKIPVGFRILNNYHICFGGSKLI